MITTHFSIPLYLSPDSRLILVGSSGCGKTNVVKNLLDRYWIDPNTGKSVFDIIILMSPTVEQDPIYEQLYSNPILHDVIVPKREVDVELLKKITDRKPDNLKICVFLDDFAFNQKVFLLPELKHFTLEEDMLTSLLSLVVSSSLLSTQVFVYMLLVS